MPQMEGQHEKTQYSSDNKIILGNSCELEKIMNFLMEVNIYEEI